MTHGRRRSSRRTSGCGRTGNSVVTLAEARRLGLSQYDGGRACKYGHGCVRRPNDSACILCVRDRVGSWVKANPDRRKRIAAAYRSRNRPRLQKSSRAWRRAHLAAARKGNRTRARRRRLEAPYLKRADEALRRARKRRATPGWTDLRAIREFYRGCPPGHHVDHVIPLSNRSVCGLHVTENLQYLTASANCAKRNRFSSIGAF